MKRFLIIAAFFAVAYLWGNQSEDGSAPAEVANSSSRITAAVFDRGNSGSLVQGSGVVIRVLSDDNDGSRHQRFIVQLQTGQTLLIAHNIDLAPRIASLRKGDTVSFNGEYEWNDKGGVIHWTHHDPQGRHVPGWIKHNGQTYQ